MINEVGVKINDENLTSDTMELTKLEDLPEPKMGVSLVIKLPNGHTRVFYPREKVDFKGNLTGTLEYSQKITPAYLKEGTVFWTNPYGKKKK